MVQSIGNNTKGGICLHSLAAPLSMVIKLPPLAVISSSYRLKPLLRFSAKRSITKCEGSVDEDRLACATSYHLNC